jgi:hypothetical protein
MDSVKYIGMDVHKESISIAVRNDVGKIVMECVIETKASMILQFINGLRGDLHVTGFSRCCYLRIDLCSLFRRELGQDLVAVT